MESAPHFGVLILFIASQKWGELLLDGCLQSFLIPIVRH